MVFKDIINNNTILTNYIDNINKKKIYNLQRFISLSQKQMHGRIADALIYMDNNMPKNKDTTITISKQNIAKLNGIAKESCARILKELQKSNNIHIDGEQILIIDNSNLSQLSDYG